MKNFILLSALTLFCGFVDLFASPGPAANAGPDQQLCETDSSFMAAAAPVISSCGLSHGKWTILSGAATFTNDTLFNSAIHLIAYGENIFEWTLYNNSCDTTRDTVIIYRYIQPIANAGANDTLCASDTIHLNGNSLIPFGPFAQGSWTQSFGPFAIISDSSQSNTTATAIPANAYHFIWTISNGSCSPASDTARLYMIATELSYILEGDSISLCQEDSIMLHIAPLPSYIRSGSYTWNTFGSVIAEYYDPSDSVLIRSLSTGTDTVIFSAEYESCPSYSDTIYIVNNILPFSNTGVDLYLCDATIGTLTGNNPQTTVQFSASGMWTQIMGPPAVIYVPDHGITNADSLIPGFDYAFVWTVSNGSCPSASDTLFIYNLHVSDADILSLPMEVCNDSGIILNGNLPPLGETAVWTGPSGVIFSPDNTSPNVTVDQLQPGSNLIIYQLQSGFCFGKPDTILLINSEVQSIVYPGIDLEACTGETISLNQSPPLGAEEGYWLSSFPELIFSPDMQSENVSIGSPTTGDYTIFWYVSNGACSSDTIAYLLKVRDGILSVESPVNIPCSDEEIILSISSAFGPETPIVVSPTLISDENIPTDLIITASTPVGAYTISYTTNSGCFMSTELELLPCAGSDAISFPNAFSPNGDGRNDIFHPLSVGNVQISIFRIYNRWGNLVYDNQAASWDGSFKGTKQEVGTYVFFAEWTENGTRKQQSGSISLIR